MKNKIQLLDIVILTEDVPEHNLKSGTIGTVVEILSNGDAFEVEFSDDNGQMYKSISFHDNQIQVINERKPIMSNDKPEKENSLLQERLDEISKEFQEKNKHSLQEMFEIALAKNNETIEDVIISSHPLEIVRDIFTLSEIHCFYLNSASGYDIQDSIHKQDMPYIAITKKYIYYFDGETMIRNPDYDFKKSQFADDNPYFIKGVESYKIDPLHLKRHDISHVFTEHHKQEGTLYPEIDNMDLSSEEKELVEKMKSQGSKDTEIIDEISSNRY